jgi:hypothetical protein
MKKTYWWRSLLFVLSGLIVVSGWIYDKYFCFANTNYCPFDKYRILVFEPIAIISIFILAISLFLFFVNDSIFLKWLCFAIVWLVLSAIFIALSPAYSGGFIGLNPTKESVSIWMGALFVIVSLGQIIWLSKRTKN